MLRMQPMPHLQTFSRLHVAGPNDATTLRELETSLRGEAGASNRDWPLGAANRDSHIVLAMECQIAVGAAEVIHPARSPIATLVWLGVAHSARRRGIGRLLIESGIEHARGEGAAVLRLRAMAVSGPALNLLVASEFVERTYDETHVVFEKSLWDERAARHARTIQPHLYGSISTHGSSAAALMVAMATIDSRFMMTPQVERVIAAEIHQYTDADGQKLLAIASAAAHRSFNVAIHCALPPVLPPHRAIGEGTISASPTIPTPEELFGLLSQRQVPLVQAHFDRLRLSENDWLVVIGFDGLRFHVFDPWRPDQGNQAVTIGEMRRSLAEKRAVCLTIGRS